MQQYLDDPANYTYLTELMDRIVAVELEALTPIKPLDAVPFFLHQQDAFPYITHRLGEDVPVDISMDQQLRTYNVIGRFVVGHVTGGIDGQQELGIYAFLPALETAFTINHWLTSEQFPEEMLLMSADPIQFKRDGGTRVFDNRGIGNLPSQIGFEFILTAEFQLDIARRY